MVEHRAPENEARPQTHQEAVWSQKEADEVLQVEKAGPLEAGHHQKVLLRIQTAKLREAKKAALRRRERERLERGGPNWVGPQQQRQLLSKAQCKELHQFWKDIWGSEGTCDPKQPAMAEWMAEMRSQTEPQEDDAALPDGEEIWKAAQGKVKSWKALGPDGLRGYWLGAFPSA